MSPSNWGWYTLLLVLGAVIAASVAYVVGIWFPGCETFLRTMGGVLQFLGVGSVAWGISEVRRSFGLRSTTAEIMAYWLGLARATGQRIWTAVRGPKLRRVTGTATVGWESLGASAKGRGKVRLGPGANIDERVAQLEHLVDGIQDALWGTQDDLQRETEQRTEAVTSERQTREAEHQEIKLRLENLAVGGLRLQTVGLLWLFAGIAMATWSHEIGSMLCTTHPT